MHLIQKLNFYSLRYCMAYQICFYLRYSCKTSCRDDRIRLVYLGENNQWNFRRDKKLVTGIVSSVVQSFIHLDNYIITEFRNFSHLLIKSLIISLFRSRLFPLPKLRFGSFNNSSYNELIKRFTIQTFLFGFPLIGTKTFKSCDNAFNAE